jgi:hypothetical protein
MEEAKGGQGKTDSHKDTHRIIKEIDDWQANKGEKKDCR